MENKDKSGAEQVAPAAVPSGDTTPLSWSQARRGHAVTHDEADEAVRRLINSHFRNGNHARASIPAEYSDDDITILDYIMEQRAAQVEPSEGACRTGANTAVRETVVETPRSEMTGESTSTPDSGARLRAAIGRAVGCTFIPHGAQSDEYIRGWWCGCRKRIEEKLAALTAEPPPSQFDLDVMRERDKALASNAALTAKLEAAETRVAELEARQRWIPVSGRLPKLLTQDEISCCGDPEGPKQSDKALVFNEHDMDSRIAIYSEVDGDGDVSTAVFMDEQGEEIPGVTHWMPLPEPPTTLDHAKEDGI